MSQEVIISHLFTEKGTLHPSIESWLHTAMGFDLAVIQNTRFIKVNTLRYHACTFYKTVWYQDPALNTNATHFYSVSDWLNLIAHEIQHRQDIGNNWFSALRFGSAYGFYWLKNAVQKKHPYYENPYEIKAFAMGCSNESTVNRWLRAYPNFAPFQRENITEKN